MSLHLRRIHSADHARADVRAARAVQDQTTDQLRDEIEADRPMLRWPINLNHGRKH